MTWHIAQTAAPTGAPSVVDLVSYGALGFVVIALVLGWLWAKPAVHQIIARAEKAEAQRDDLITVYEQQVLPVLSASVAATAKVLEAVEEINRRFDRDHTGSRRSPDREDSARSRDTGRAAE